MNIRGKIAIALFAITLGCSEQAEVVPDAGEGGVLDRDGQIDDDGAASDDAASEQDGEIDPIDTDCDSSGCSRFATCDDSSGKVVCTCRDGYTGNGYNCADVNECVEDDVCDENAFCENLPGEYSCECKPGYQGDGETCTEVDECEENEDDCSSNATCTNTVGSFACNCNEGFEGNGRRCTDIDECEGDTTTCHRDAECVNEQPGFRCECQAGFTGDGYASGDSSGCRDIDECSENTHDCPVGTRCRNTRGGYECDCDIGYALDGDTCRPLCEIALEDPVKCDPDYGICSINPEGEAECIECKPPYMGNGQTCAPDPDCASLDCGTNEVCVNDGGYSCVCAYGFKEDPEDGCINTDECASEEDNVCDCNSEDDCSTPPNVNYCYNYDTVGGYSCECVTGYRKKEGVCANIDECDEDPNNCGTSGDASCICDPLSTCNDLDPGFECICDDGFKGDGREACLDIDECNDEKYPHECNSEVSSCANLPGDEGKYRCIDIDECDPNETEHPDDCEEYATCDNFVCEDATSCRDPDFIGYTCGCDVDDGFVETDDGTCYCDLTGYWAMRLDVLITWPAVGGARGGDLNTTAWELHKYDYDGETIRVEKKGCGQQDWPELRTLTDEFYSSYLPIDVFDPVDLVRGVDVPLSPAKARPGKNFATPTEAAVVGMDLDNPATDDWPDFGDSNIPWHDSDGDGILGATIWSKGTNQDHAPVAGARYDTFDYAPILMGGFLDTEILARGGCFSAAVRTRTHLNVEVKSCSRLTGTVSEDELPDSLFYTCTVVEEDDWGEDDKPGRDVSCGTGDDSDWNTDVADRCNDTHLEWLNGAAPNQTTTSSFELVKMEKSNPTCADVRALLPSPY